LELEALRKAIETSFHSTGTERSWLAEDIALSIESSLRSLGDECVLSLGEIDSIVVNILRETGFPDTARDYRKRKKTVRGGIPVELERVVPLVAGEMPTLDGAPAPKRIAASVVDACRVLSIDEAPTSLILELARFYRSALPAAPAEYAAPAKKPERNAPWLVSRQEIVDALPEDARKLVDSDILSLHGVSQIFPAIRVALNLDKIARAAGLEPPSAEIALYPALSDIADAVAKTAETARRLAAGNAPDRAPENIPLRLRALDPAGFAEKWLCASPADSAACVMEILAETAGKTKGEILIDPK